jgi:hypothetical protein
MGMDRNRFNAEVRPYLVEIPIGDQGIAFDRLDLDVWIDDYKSRNGRPGRNYQEVSSWDNVNYPDFASAAASGTLRSVSKDKANFAKALAEATEKKRKGT